MTSPIPDRAVLEGLLERVRAAIGPDRELDAALSIAFGIAPEGGRWLLNHPGCFVQDGVAVRRKYADGSGFSSRFSPHGLTASLDAITALVASRGFGWQVDQTEGAFVSDEDDQWHETCATPALSLVGAWLVAEMEREEGR